MALARTSCSESLAFAFPDAYTLQSLRTQRLQNPSIKEYTLNHGRVPKPFNYQTFLTLGFRFQF